MWFDPAELLSGSAKPHANSANLGNEISGTSPKIKMSKTQNDEKARLNDKGVINLLDQAINKTSISMRQFWHFCDVDDIADIYAGNYTVEELHAYALSWANSTKKIPNGNDIPFPKLELEVGKCNKCQHFIPDKIGDGTGVGDCAIKSVASRKVLLWPNRETFCKDFRLIK